VDNGDAVSATATATGTAMAMEMAMAFHNGMCLLLLLYHGQMIILYGKLLDWD